MVRMGLVCVGVERSKRSYGAPWERAKRGVHLTPVAVSRNDSHLSLILFAGRADLAL